MGHTALILGDQLLPDHPALEGAERAVLIESTAVMGRRPVHRRRLHAVLVGMRAYAQGLRARGVEVVEHRGAESIATALREHHDGETLVAAHPNRRSALLHLRDDLGVEIVDSSQFLNAPERFAAYARGRRSLTMEHFYREMRREHRVLLDDAGEPLGGRWNFDAENRRPPKEGLRAPAPYRPREGEIDAEVREDLDRLAIPAYGDDGPRQVAVTRDEARRALQSFIVDRLHDFGPWQDAMVPGERMLFHANLAAPLNLGVLDPLDVVRAAERAHHEDGAPLQSVEGFVRQIIGWREYVWGMYWLRAQEWPRRNALRARRALPAAFTASGPDAPRTGWNCLDTTLDAVREDAYAHHIERLMVLGNTLLLHGTRPVEALRWFETSFIDGAEWVMAPNAAGMALYADGGEMMTKPYAAGGNYISKMSRHCPSCRFDPKKRTGPDACPLTALYWDFLARHAQTLEGNHRMAMPLRSLGRFDAAELAAIRARADDARAELEAPGG